MNDTLATELDLAAVLRADNGVDVRDGAICSDDEERQRLLRPAATVWPTSTLRATTVPSIGETISVLLRLLSAA